MHISRKLHKALFKLLENRWPNNVLGSVLIQVYAGECTPSVD